MLPRPLNHLCLSPFLNGEASPQRYLVESGARRFVVNFRTLVLIEALQRGSEPAEAVAYIQERTNEVVSEKDLLASISRLPPALFDQQVSREYKTPITCRTSLISSRLVARVAAQTARLFSPKFLFPFAIIFAANVPFIWRAARESIAKPELGWETFGVCALGFILSAIIHELGHASAVARNGMAPGHIGFGLYWCFPAFYTDVNAAWKLAPNKRVMVDLGGIYFQLIFLILLTPLAFFGPMIGSVRLLLVFSLYSVLQNLNPVFKMDGYWILADLAQLPNLHARTRNFWRHALTHGTGEIRSRLVFLLYSLVVCVYFGYVAALIFGFARVQLLLRVRTAGAYLRLCVGSCQEAEWARAFGQFEEAFRVSAFPSLTLLILVLWLLGVWRRSPSRISYS